MPEAALLPTPLRRPELAGMRAAGMLAELDLGRMGLLGAPADADAIEIGRVEVHADSMGSGPPAGKRRRDKNAIRARAMRSRAGHRPGARAPSMQAAKKEAARRRPKSREETPKEGSKGTNRISSPCSASK